MTGSRPRRGAVRRLARRLGGKRSAEAARALAEILAAKPDAKVRELTRSALAGVSDQPEIDAVCDVLVTTGDAELEELARRHAWSPSDPGRRALVLFLLGEFDAYAKLDHDGGLLAAARAAEDHWVRERLAERARAAGRVEWVRAATAGTQRLAKLSDTEWDALTAILAATARWDDIWRLARQAPPVRSARLLVQLGEHAWRPAAQRQQAAFDELVRLARECARQPFGSIVEELACLGSGSETGPPRDLAVTPDGMFLAAHYVRGVEPCSLIWDLRRAERVSGLETPGDGISPAIMTQDGRLLMTSRSDGRVVLEPAPDGELDTGLARGYISELTVTPDGSLLASVGSDTATRASRTSVSLWHQPSGKPSGYGLAGDPMAISQDGTLLATWDDGFVQLWRLQSGELIGSLGRRGARPVSSLLSTPNGKTVVAVRDVSRRESDIEVRRLPHCKIVGSIPVTRPCCCAVSPDGRLLAVGGDQAGDTLWRLSGGYLADELVLWLPEHDRARHLNDTLVPPAASRRVAFTPDGRFLVSSRPDGTWLWSIPEYQPRTPPLPMTDARVLPTERGALLAGPDVEDTGKLRVWRYEPSLVAEMARKPVVKLGDTEIQIMARCRGDGGERALAAFTVALVRFAHAFDMPASDRSDGV